jgi:hypothetical protein
LIKYLEAGRVLIEFDDDSGYVEAFRSQLHENPLPEVIDRERRRSRNDPDLLCNRCGKLGREPEYCEYCEKER